METRILDDGATRRHRQDTTCATARTAILSSVQCLIPMGGLLGRRGRDRNDGNYWGEHLSAAENVHGQTYVHREGIPLALKEHLEKQKYSF